MSKFNYLYYLGHQPDLGIAEYSFLTNTNEIETDNKVILSDTYLDIQKTGSLIFSAKILESWPRRDFNEKLYFDALERHLVSDTPKKLGLLIPNYLRNETFSLVKSVGVKNLNILTDKTYPNYGHWKQTKNWILLINYKEQVLVIKIENYFNQQFWASLDSKLPTGDMKRGLINLKLGRTLLNLTKNQSIWDLFCGAGRLFTAGIDLKTQFLASDIDQICRQETNQNYEFTKMFFQKSNQIVDLAVLQEPFISDVREIDLTKISEKMQINLKVESLSIVTEGYLGKNFTKAPTEDEVKSEFEDLRQIWTGFLIKLNGSNITEIVFCLPFYTLKGKDHLPTFLDDLAKSSNYKYYIFPNRKQYLKYKRHDSLVGHLILKLIK